MISTLYFPEAAKARRAAVVLSVRDVHASRLGAISTVLGREPTTSGQHSVIHALWPYGGKRGEPLSSTNHMETKYKTAFVTLHVHQMSKNKGRPVRFLAIRSPEL